MFLNSEGQNISSIGSAIRWSCQELAAFTSDCMTNASTAFVRNHGALLAFLFPLHIIHKEAEDGYQGVSKVSRLDSRHYFATHTLLWLSCVLPIVHTIYTENVHTISGLSVT
jgi:hypothetical protein